MGEKPINLEDSLGIPISPPPTIGKRLTLMGYLRSRMITGLLVAFPLAVTLFFARFLFRLLDNWAYPIARGILGHPVPGLGLGLAVVLVFGLGVLAHNVLGRRIIGMGEKIFARIPFLRPVYMGAREVTRAFGSDRHKAFQRAVLVPYPNPDSYVLAFVTGEYEIATPEGRQTMITVFMPSTPNPTTGFFIAYRADATRPTGLTVDEAARMVISGGLVCPDPRRFFPPHVPDSGGTP